MNYNDLIIDESYTVIQAMEKLDSNGKKILFICRNNILCAALTDGDIRRWILKNGDLNAEISLVANYSPQYIYEDMKYKAKSILKELVLEALPVLNSKNEITDVIFSYDGFSNHRQDLLNVPVVINAGGVGSRLYPYTKILPKPLIPIGEVPISEHIINRFLAYGVNCFYFIINYKKNMIKAYFNETEKNYDVIFIDEEKPLGTGGGLKLLNEKIYETFIFTNCDILINEDFSKIYNYHKENKNLITMVCSLKNFTIPYGVVEIADNGDIKEMREKPKFSFLTNTGCYIVEPEIMRYIDDDEIIDFPSIIERCKSNGEKVGIFPISEGSWADMGQFDELDKMKRKLESN